MGDLKRGTWQVRVEVHNYTDNQATRPIQSNPTQNLCEFMNLYRLSWVEIFNFFFNYTVLSSNINKSITTNLINYYHLIFIKIIYIYIKIL